LLDALVALGSSMRLQHDGTKRYDANLEKHHHLVCTHCGTIATSYDPSSTRGAASGAFPSSGGFIAEAVSVQRAGVCARCAAAAAAARLAVRARFYRT